MGKRRQGKGTEMDLEHVRRGGDVDWVGEKEGGGSDGLLCMSVYPVYTPVREQFKVVTLGFSSSSCGFPMLPFLFSFLQAVQRTIRCSSRKTWKRGSSDAMGRT